MPTSTASRRHHRPFVLASRATALLLFIGMLPGAAHAGFIGPTNYTVGQYPLAGSLGDLDGDGDLDLAVANWGTSTVSILRNNGNGTFSAATNYPVPGPPLDIEIGNLQVLDQSPDLVVATGNGVSVFYGNGDGSLAEPTHYSLSASSVAIGNFNGGSAPDIAVADGNTVRILYGDGVIGFGPPIHVSSELGLAGDVRVGDVNGDGHPDLLIPNRLSDAVSIYTGDGAGNFVGPTPTGSGGSQARALALAHLNGDGAVDMAVVNFNSNNVGVKFGTGTPPTYFQAPTTYPTGAGAKAVVVADFNADNQPDLAVANYNANTLSVLNGNGNGTFAAAVQYPFGSAPSDLLTGDLDGDGDSDLVIVNYHGSNVSVLLTDNTPPTVPGAPTIGTASLGGSGRAFVSFTAPASNGGSPITGYTATSSPGGITSTFCNLSFCQVDGLTNGTAYTFTVTATNAVGTGAASAPSNSVTPVARPSAPTIGTATAGNAQATVTFTPPASDGGSAITGYTAVSTPGDQSSIGCTASPCTVTGLTNGTAYTFIVYATSAVGEGDDSAPSNSVTPATVPDAPTIGTAIRGNGQATVAFTTPFNGGSVITGYTATSAPGGFTSSGCTASPCTVSGLTNGTAYTFTVTATNALGTGAASAASNSVTPATVPGAPANLVATAGNGSASFQFDPPPGDGGPAVIDYTVTCAPGNRQVTGAGSPLMLGGLTNGTTYACSVTARNEVGSGAASATVNVVPAGAIAITSSPLPNGSFGVAYSHTVVATGSPAPSFSISAGALPPGLTLNADSGVVSGTPTSVGTSNGTITAGNGVGTPATQDFAITIAAVVPGAPTGVVATRANASVSVAFVPPVNTGGSAIISYQATCAGQSASGAGSPIVVGGLANGVAVTCTVIATNAAGNSVPSAASNSVTPATVPGAPTNLAATPGNGSASFQFSPPASNGGAAIIDYTVLCMPGNGQVTGGGAPLTLGGLTNGTSYGCSVRARNELGSGAASATVNVTPTGGGALSADLSITKTNGTGFVTGGAATSYLIVVSNAGPSAVTGARVEDALGGEFSNATWTCVGESGGSCAAGGTGNLNELVGLPVGASVRFTLTAQVAALPETPVSNVASVTPPGPVTDPNLSNNAASDGPDIRGIFRSGF